MTRAGIAAVLLLLAVAGCGSSSDTGSSADDDLASAAPQSGSSETSGSPVEGDSFKVLETGFGQDGGYVVPVAILQNTSDRGGQTVTVNYNLLDAGGDLLQTVNQVENFSVPGQTIAVTGWAEEKKPVDKVQVTVDVEDDGTFANEDVDLGSVNGKPLQTYGTWSAHFVYTNPTDQPLKDSRIGIVCRDAGGTISGGGSDFPELIPPRGQVTFGDDAVMVITGKPAKCTAYVNYGSF